MPLHAAPPQTHDIFVSNPSAVALAGHLDVLCFDKTGTLTEPGLDLQARGAGRGGLAALGRGLAWLGVCSAGAAGPGAAQPTVCL